MALFTKLRIFRDLLAFFWEQKFWWLVPVLGVLIFLGALLVLAQGSAILPFIYTLF